MDENSNNIAKPRKRTGHHKATPAKISYVNVKRTEKGYRDKYRKEVEKAMKAYAKQLNKTLAKPDLTDEEWETVFTTKEWMDFFKTNLLPLDKLSEKRMIGLFRNDRPELNKLLILHNTKASENLAEVYFKRYMKTSPTQWYDLDDFKQMANEGLAIAAERFDLDYSNRFLTYATWWVLNKVRKPNQEKGAMVNHKSLSSTLNPQDPTNTTTLEEVLTPESLSPDWQSPSDHHPFEMMDLASIENNMNLYATIKEMRENSYDKIDENKVKQMVGYLLSIVERNENSYNNKQIYLYLFKKIFNHCQGMFSDNKKLVKYASEAAKSKSELLKRLNMSEKQYEMACKNLTRSGGFDYGGI